MNKQMYKELLSESYNETSYYKAIVNKVETMTKDYPNDMQLGAAVRRFLTEEFWKLPQKERKSKWQKELDKI